MWINYRHLSIALITRYLYKLTPATVIWINYRALAHCNNYKIPGCKLPPHTVVWNKYGAPVHSINCRVPVYKLSPVTIFWINHRVSLDELSE